MIIDERDIRKACVMEAGRRIMTAARTAPKGKGVDLIEVCMVTDEDIARISDKMKDIFKENGFHFFLRDAENILAADALILIGTREGAMGLNCGHCGYSRCGDRPENVPCALNSVDVGIAIGSACATAADCRVDTRVMFSAGLAAQRLGLPCTECRSVFAIPLSASSKNPFFDRKPQQ